MYEAIFSAVGVAVGSLITGWFGYLKYGKKSEIAQKKQDREEERNEAEQALDIYQSVAKELRADVRRLTIQSQKLEEDYIRVREENAVLRTENKYLKQLGGVPPITPKQGEDGRVHKAEG